MALPRHFIYLPLLSALFLAIFVKADYWEERKNFLDDEAALFMGSKIQMSSNERIVNDILMEAKEREISTSFENQQFPPSRHFFDAKTDIMNSEVFQIIKNLPKGALLHGHDTGMVSLDYLIQNITYKDHLYVCIKISPENFDLSVIKYFKFSKLQPDNINDLNCEWKLMDDIRKQYGKDNVDQWLRKELSLLTQNPKEKYPNVDVVWDYFNNLFMKVDGLLTYKPVFKEYYMQVLEELRQDNIMYLELRGTLPTLYDTEGNKWEGADVLSVYKEATDEYMENHPDFFGARFIYAPLKFVNDDQFNQYLSLARELHQKFPDFLAGFDLVGQEDRGRPLSDFAERILSLPNDLKLFFHAGETNWQGITDLNLVDALLLNTTRIGHGFAIVKHPKMMQLVKERGIAIEVNPISNQVLCLVDDLRNHPAAELFSDNYPVVISSDDPTFWDVIGLSYDFYEAFMGLCSRSTDLRFLKQLSLNSILYSAMPATEKERALELWKNKWEQFLRNITIDFLSKKIRIII